MSIALGLLLMAAAGETATPPSPPQDSDPMVCERIQEIGSLVRKKRVCMKKSEWDEQRRANKLLIDRSQIQRGVGGPTG